MKFNGLLIISIAALCCSSKVTFAQPNGANQDSSHSIRYSIALAVGQDLVINSPGIEGTLSYFRYNGNFIYGARALMLDDWSGFATRYQIAVALGPEAGISVGRSGIRASISAGLGILMFHGDGGVAGPVLANFWPQYVPAPAVTTFYLDMPLDFSLMLMPGRDLGFVFTGHLDLNVGHPLFGVGAGFVFYR